MQNLPDWLADGVLYQVYPASFRDGNGNGDGIGDLPGLLAKLDYLEWLGVTTVWINPCFASPFTDGGYDVADYERVAPRYGTESDLIAIFEDAHRRGMRVLLDLVAGHTSDQHPWFADSAASERGEHADRYIWTPRRDLRPPGFQPSPGARDGCFLPNFFVTQPALNFGYGRPDPREPWRQSPGEPGPRANRAVLRGIMSHWLERGADGFRVDMAASLVKDDPGGREVRRLWREVRAGLDRDFPETAIVSEWGEPAEAVAAGFHLDFFLHFRGRAYRSLLDNGEGARMPDWEPGPCYFDAEGEGAPAEFLTAWETATAAIGPGSTVCLPTSNHDFPRPVCGGRDAAQVRAVMVLVLTWPSVPALYYGDEIGMRFILGLPDYEGSELGEHYNRAGSRTPMQWDDGDNAGFSAGADLYLPIDPDPARPTVAGQRDDPDSLLTLVRELIGLRRAHRALRPAGSVTVLAGRERPYPMAYLREHGDERFLIAINPRREPAAVGAALDAVPQPVLLRDATATGDAVELSGFGYGVWRLPER